MSDVSLEKLLEEYAAAPSPELMAHLVEGYLPLSRAIARRFAGLGIELEDLQQVAAMALMKAIERFDPRRGLKFSTYAAPTITGEVRNYIRDKGSLIRVSRDVRARLGSMQRARDELIRRWQREPSMREIADEMRMPYEELLALLDQRDGTETTSLNAPLSEEDAREMEMRLGVNEEGFERVEQQDWLRWVLNQVTPKERSLLELRYLRRLGQRETARELGVSQMQVSRMERRVLSRLRETAEDWRAPR